MLLGACCSCANVPFRASTSTGKYPWEMLSPTIRTLGIDSLIGTVGRFGSHAVFAPALPLLLLLRHPKQFSRCGGTFAGYSKWHAPVDDSVFNSHDQPTGHDVCARVLFPGPDVGQRAGEEAPLFRPWPIPLLEDGSRTRVSSSVFIITAGRSIAPDDCEIVTPDTLRRHTVHVIFVPLVFSRLMASRTYTSTMPPTMSSPSKATVPGLLTSMRRAVRL